MNISKLKQILSTVNDDFDVNIAVQKRISDIDLSKMSYPYPFEFEDCSINGYDIGHSDKTISLFVEIHEIGNNEHLFNFDELKYLSSNFVKACSNGYTGNFNDWFKELDVNWKKIANNL